MKNSTKIIRIRRRKFRDSESLYKDKKKKKQKNYVFKLFFFFFFALLSSYHDRVFLKFVSLALQQYSSLYTRLFHDVSRSKTCNKTHCCYPPYGMTELYIYYFFYFKKHTHTVSSATFSPNTITTIVRNFARFNNSWTALLSRIRDFRGVTIV